MCCARGKKFFLLYLRTSLRISLRASCKVIAFCLIQCECVDPDSQVSADPNCGIPEYQGDGHCDDENNNGGCLYDGGDCCPETVEGGKVKKNYCDKVVFDCSGFRVVRCGSTSHHTC